MCLSGAALLAGLDLTAARRGWYRRPRAAAPAAVEENDLREAMDAALHLNLPRFFEGDRARSLAMSLARIAYGMSGVLWAVLPGGTLLTGTMGMSDEVEEALVAARTLADTLPYPIAHAFDGFVTARSLASAVFAVESVFRFTSVVVKSAYLQRAHVASSSMNDAIRRCLLRPSMGTYRQFLQLARRDSAVWHSLLLDELDGVVRACGDSGLDEVVRIRNEGLAHAGSELPADLRDKLLSTVVHQSQHLLEVLHAYSRTRLLVQKEAEGWLSCVGCLPVVTDTAPASLDPAPAVLMGLQGGDLPLFPLVVRRFVGYKPELPSGRSDTLLVFDGMERDELVYVGQFGRGHGKTWVEHYRELLGRKAIPTVPLSHSDAGSSEHVRRARAAFEEDLRFAHDARDVHLDIDILDPSVMRAIDDFIGSDLRMALLVGDGGIGKTTNLFGAGQRARERGDLFLRMDARSVFGDSKTGVADALRTEIERQLQIIGARAEHVLQVLSDSIRAENPSARLVLAIDGLDEVGAPRRGSDLLEKIARWHMQHSAPLSHLRVIVSLRSVYYEDLSRVRRPGSLPSLYRPTRKSVRGSDAPLDAIWVLPPRADHLDVVRTRYEGYRAARRGNAPLTAFDELPERAKEGCRNPRWMVELLEAFDGCIVPRTLTHGELWRRRVDNFVYARVDSNTSRHPLFPKRAQLADSLTNKMLESGRTSIAIDELEQDPRIAALLRRSGDESPLSDLLSENVLRLEYDDTGILNAGRLAPLNDLTAAALLAAGEFFRTTEPAAWITQLDRHSERPLWSALGRAVVMGLAARVSDGYEAPESGRMLPSGLFAEFVLEVAAEAWSESIAQCIVELPDDEREEKLDAIQALGWSSGAQISLRLLAEAIMRWPATKWTEGSVVLVARTLRHAEDVPAIETWLSGVAEARSDLRRVAIFNLAEVLRERGLWRRAERLYGSLIEVSDDRIALLSLACRGECRIWLDERLLALEDLSLALARTDQNVEAVVRCNVHLKAGIAARLARMFPRAVRELAAAANLARQSGFVTELAKVCLELGLVAAALGLYEDAEQQISDALARHEAQAFVKGRKKAHFCLGHLYERWDRAADAVVQYRASLALNEAYFDLLGLKLCHEALGRTLRSTAPTLSMEHLAQARHYHSRLSREDQVDGDFAEL